MLRLAQKAFFPSLPPFPLLHVDTRWKFREMYLFRNWVEKNSGMKLITHINPDGIKSNINPFDHGSALHTDIMKTQSLKQALDKYKYDAALVEQEEMKRNQELKKGLFHSEAPLINGIPKISVQSFGLYITLKSIRVKAQGFFPYLIGQN